MPSSINVRTSPRSRARWRNDLAAERQESRDSTKVTLPEGQVIVEAHGLGWFLVQIGRAKYTKRFNLSAAEAAQLWPLLRDNLSITGDNRKLSPPR